MHPGTAHSAKFFCAMLLSGWLSQTHPMPKQRGSSYPYLQISRGAQFNTRLRRDYLAFLVQPGKSVQFPQAIFNHAHLS